VSCWVHVPPATLTSSLQAIPARGSTLLDELESEEALDASEDADSTEDELDIETPVEPASLDIEADVEA